MKNIIIATIKSWNIIHAKRMKRDLKDIYNVFTIDKKENLTFDNVANINPAYIFFPHWSWIIPKEIYSNFECIVFHMTDLPFGRGGSPLQNLIVRKVYQTKITALKVEKELDAGDIYLKEDLCISTGSAEEIFIETAKIIFTRMIPHILKNKIKPYKQKGRVVQFKRRTSVQSNVLEESVMNIHELYDFIRMLDGEGYPKAFIKIGALKIMFSEVHQKSGKLVGRFEVIDEE